MDFTLENRTNYKKANSKDVKKIAVMDKNRKLKKMKNLRFV